MLTKVEVRTRQGSLLNLELDDISDGLIVQSVEGLDPVKATLVSSSFAGLDGEQYQSSRRETRNIKLQLGLDPADPSVSSVQSLRKKLYTFFMPKSEVNLQFFMEDGLTVNIAGRVESFETVFFTQDPTVDISIICFDPDFYDPTTVNVTGMTTADVAPTNLLYEGSVETGLELVLNINRTLTEFTVYHTPPSGELRTLNFVAPLVAGDVLTISTIPGAKGATLLRAGSITSVLYGVSPQSSWIELSPGVNAIRVYAEGAAIPLTLDYVKKYGGL